jgi:hypothetical protein
VDCNFRLLNPAFNKRFLRDFVFPSVVKHATTMGSQLAQIEEYTKVRLVEAIRSYARYDH